MNFWGKWQDIFLFRKEFSPFAGIPLPQNRKILHFLSMGHKALVWRISNKPRLLER